MNYPLFILLLIFLLLIIMGFIIARSGKSTDENTAWEMESWECPECGFNVQAGNNCIYCGTEKSKIGPGSNL